jgi:hypothetical protein
MWTVCVVPDGTGGGLAAGERVGLGVGRGVGLGVGRDAVRIAVGEGRGDRDGDGMPARVALGEALVTTALGVGLDGAVVGEAAACWTVDGWP